MNEEMANALLSSTEESEPCLVPLDSVHIGDSPRISGIDADHVRTLAELETLPPILVHRRTMRVIDGAHRLSAARSRKAKQIAVRFFEGDSEAAFMLSVRANVEHGLPLAMADRTAAAERILSVNPRLSDRTIAMTTGLSAGTIAGIRKRSTDGSAQSNVRLGRDGKVRPLNSANGRRAASALITGNPEMPLREVARSAGISLATACDVRRRMNQGDDPVPQRQREGQRRMRPAPGHRPGRVIGEEERAMILGALRKDPSLRYSDTGRATLAWLCRHVLEIDQGHDLLGALPPHCLGRVAELARGCAEAWQALAEEAGTRLQQQGAV